MSFFERVFRLRRLVFTVVGLLALVGAVSWLTMVRQEDPRLPDFWGQIVAPFPGADAQMVERLVLEPIEDALAEVAEIKDVQATAFSEMAVLNIELRDDTANFDEAWDEVREALDEARREFPEGVPEPVVDDELHDQESIVLALTGSPDLLVLLDRARLLKHELLALTAVSKVRIVADPGEQVTLEVDDALMRSSACMLPSCPRNFRLATRFSLAVRFI